MSQIAAMLQAHPQRPSSIDGIGRCVETCFACVETCTACADACLVERDIARLVNCIRLNLDCATICSATARVVIRLQRRGAQPMQAQLAACAAACRACGEECARHGAMHEHCRICAQACLECEDACEELMKAIRKAA